jgi:hypothetical protein
MNRRMQDAIETKKTSLLIQLILVRGSSWHFNDREKTLFRATILWIDQIPAIEN